MYASSDTDLPQSGKNSPPVKKPDGKPGGGTLEGDEEESDNGPCQEVTTNSLVVERVCSFLSSKELTGLRLVNRLFQEEASKRLCVLRQPLIRLKTAKALEEFLVLMQKHQELRIQPWPFSSVQLTFEVLDELMCEKLAPVLGSLVASYSFSFSNYFDLSWVPSRPGTSVLASRVATLLFNAPQLSHLELAVDLWLEDSDLHLFPNLLSHLRVLELRKCSGRDTWNHPPDAHSLLELIFSRAPRLKEFKLSALQPAEMLRVLQSLLQHRPHNPPMIFLLDQLTVDPFTVPHLPELMAMNLSIKDVSVCVQHNQHYIAWPLKNEQQVRQMLGTVEEWLNEQRLSFFKLCLAFQKERFLVSFAVPSMPALKELIIQYPVKDEARNLPYAGIVLPFVGNPFPALQTLCLEYYREDYELFASACLANLWRLELRHLRTALSRPSWHLPLPQLTSLHIQLDVHREKFYANTIRHILTNMTRLVQLSLDVLDQSEVPFYRRSLFHKVRQSCKNPQSRRNPNDVCNYWSLLTGNAPRSVVDWKFLEADERFEAGDAGSSEEDPVNSYQAGPSLENMKALNSLRLCVRLVSNADAVLYMSRTAKLRPLQNLVLTKFQYDVGLTDKEIGRYKTALSEFHSQVSFD